MALKSVDQGSNWVCTYEGNSQNINYGNHLSHSAYLTRPFLISQMEEKQFQVVTFW